MRVLKEYRRNDSGTKSLTSSDLQMVEGFSLKYLRIKVNSLSFHPDFQLSGLLNEMEMVKYRIVLQVKEILSVPQEISRKVKGG